VSKSLSGPWDGPNRRSFYQAGGTTCSLLRGERRGRAKWVARTRNLGGFAGKNGGPSGGTRHTLTSMNKSTERGTAQLFDQSIKGKTGGRAPGPKVGGRRNARHGGWSDTQALEVYHRDHKGSKGGVLEDSGRGRKKGDPVPHGKENPLPR